MTIPRVLRTPLAAVLVLLSACGLRGSAVGPQQTSRFDVLTRVELEDLSNRTALQAIRQLRPRWVRGRGPSIGAEPGERDARLVRGEERVQAYVDGIRQNSLGSLDSVRATDVETIRFLSASAATARFGSDHPAGAILVVTRTY